ncbi:MAG: DUF305 domain-containing protein [Candidatus Woesearchaeota archaeon]
MFADKKGFVVLTLVVIVIGSVLYFGKYDLMTYDEETFITEMILHHEQAVNASIIMLNSKNLEVKSLAEKIILLQSAEIKTLDSWLNEWYNETSYGRKAMNRKMNMPKLSYIPSKERDMAYLYGMIEHHEQAIVMAQKVLKTSPREEIKNLAENIIVVQSEEILLMKKMINDLEKSNER